MNNNVIIIAEAGVNHNGCFQTAKTLIKKAAEAGADYIKFQTFKTELNISKIAKKAKYQIENTQNENETQFEMVKKLELSFEDFKKLKIYCDSLNIGFLSTGFDSESVDFLSTLNMDFFKIPSGEITNLSLIKHIASKKKPIILSTGMANMDEVGFTINFLIDHGCDKKNIFVLHCNTEYPTPFLDVNLKAMNNIGKFYDVEIGYSDHTLGIEVPVAAVALGAKIIEKHFTLDNSLPGPDHRCSLNPVDLKKMITSIRNIEQAMSGDGQKKVSNSEKKNIAIARKSLHLKYKVSKGEILREEDLIVLRPGDGISPLRLNEVIGKKTKKTLEAFHKLSINDLK